MWVGKRLIELTPHFLYFYFEFHWQSNLSSIGQPRGLRNALPSVLRLSAPFIPREKVRVQV